MLCFSKAIAFLGLAVVATHALPGTSPNQVFSLSAREWDSTRSLSDDMLAALEARDSVVARCAQTSKRDCPCDSKRFYERFMEVAERAIDARICLACCGNNCTCARSDDIVCTRTEEDFVNRAYDEAARDVVLPRCIL
ncbi:hypothetical protein B0H17DRAFT_1037926 [Mycena rosella]|uniref:Uncharacterized protein n=1 Tax=Mycena rosella TaxID=1033263 RepID=A0AAD7GU87_MYCRO|nr:hypothetical protein B0H17DRAFT_1037926 [Mycena rosella]